MPKPVFRDRSGFTLIEFLVALLILTIGLLGLLESVNLSMRHNSANKLRAAAIVLADEIIAVDRSAPVDGVVSVAGTKNMAVGAVFVNYSVVKAVDKSIGARSSHVTLRIKWRERGAAKEHIQTALISETAD